jgi:short-subunit dehydrogenase
MQDKVIIIVGATGGIGTALTRQLAPTRAKLVLGARNKVNLATLAEELSGEVLTVPTEYYSIRPGKCIDTSNFDAVWSN